MLDVVAYGKLSTVFQTMILIAVILYLSRPRILAQTSHDLISAMGYENPPVLQKVYWACTEGALAQALMTSGGLTVVQGVSIVCGLPFTFALNFMVVSLWRALKDEFGIKATKSSKGFIVHVGRPRRVRTETAGANAPDRKTRIVAALKNVIYPFDAIRKAKIAVGADDKFARQRRHSPVCCGLGSVSSRPRKPAGGALRGVVVLPHLHFLHRKHPPRASRIQKYSW